MNTLPGNNVCFYFTCPETGAVFESADFHVTEFAGVVTHAQGRKTLDAKVALNAPCPACGRRHVYHADELLCPFTGAGAEKP